MNRTQERHLSRTISHALRHAPHLYELEIDEEGWTPVSHLIQGLQGHRSAWRGVDIDLIKGIVARDNKGRYELDEHTARIRALYGHSTATRLKKMLAAPPALLYHGTSPEIATIILSEGLKSMARQYVHHSVDTATALEVGHRKDDAPVLLHIDAAAAHAHGINFYEGNALIWLSDDVPPEFISATQGLDNSSGS